MSNDRKTDADFVAMLRDQIEYVRETDGEFCEVDPFGISLIVDELEELHRLRPILAASPDFLPLARVAELHSDALTMGGCAEVNECDLAALTAEVLQGREKRLSSDELDALQWAVDRAAPSGPGGHGIEDHINHGDAVSALAKIAGVERLR